ncbi:MAG TPA: YhfC family glutamic-type intramembrane protease, partial [Promineifilum sp.]|nr:YhfC family glutamic-type intramembrane protease [Promineifilum sp.]
MNFALLAINITLMLVIPVVLAIFIHRRTSASWRFFFIGAVTFILSQVLHIPFNWLVGQTGLLPDSMDTTANLLITAIFLGLSAGVFEETARYLAYRFWARDARSWSRGLMLGAGHGGIESILVGVLSAVSIIGLVVTVNNEAIMST